MLPQAAPSCLRPPRPAGPSSKLLNLDFLVYVVAWDPHLWGGGASLAVWVTQVVLLLCRVLWRTGPALRLANPLFLPYKVSLCQRPFLTGPGKSSKTPAVA